jgi:hypothetical protein
MSTQNMSTQNMSTQNTDLKGTVRKLAEEAFNRRLISGYGDGEFKDKYQINYQGKPRHLSFERAKAFLSRLIEEAH